MLCPWDYTKTAATSGFPSNQIPRSLHLEMSSQSSSRSHHAALQLPKKIHFNFIFFLSTVQHTTGLMLNLPPFLSLSFPTPLYHVLRRPFSRCPPTILCVLIDIQGTGRISIARSHGQKFLGGRVSSKVFIKCFVFANYGRSAATDVGRLLRLDISVQIKYHTRSSS
jgi:hypothetical protein